MSRSLDLIAADLVAALGALVRRPAVDRALAEGAAAVAEAVVAAGASSATIVHRGPGDYEVVAAGPGLLAREFGTLGAPPRRVIAPAIDRLAGRRP